MAGDGRTYTREEVASHNTEQSSWIIINDSVYDITKFAGMHVSLIKTSSIC